MKKTTTSKTDERQPHRIRLPGFITEKEVGLGDAIKRATSGWNQAVSWMRKPCRNAQPVVRFYRMALKVRPPIEKQLSNERRNTMEQTTETSIIQPGSATAATPQPLPAPCPTCGGAPGSQARSYVYALGRIEPRFPSPAVEKEFAQVAGRTETKGKTDRETLQAVLSTRENRYLARQLCFVLTIQGLETYIVTPRDSADFDLLVEAVRANPRPTDLDVVIGMLGPIAPPEMCNGLMVPIVAFDQVYSFDRDALIKAIPRPEKVAAKEFGPAAEELFDRIVQMTDNAGATDENRALNYLAVRYPAIYATAAEAFARNSSLTALDVRPSPLSGVRKILDCIWSFTHRQNDVIEKFFCRVDVTEEFPFLVTRVSPYFDR